MAAGGGGGGVLPFDAAGGGGGVFPFDAAGGGGTFAPVDAAGGGVVPFAAGFGASLPAVLGASLAGDLGASFLSPALGANFLSPAFLSPGLVSAALGYSFLASVGAVYFAFLLCLPESKGVSSGRTSVTTPAATVFPPSLKANLHPLVIVNGKWSLALIFKLSPGLAILTDSGKKISTAESAVLK